DNRTGFRGLVNSHFELEAKRGNVIPELALLRSRHVLHEKLDALRSIPRSNSRILTLLGNEFIKLRSSMVTHWLPQLESQVLTNARHIGELAGLQNHNDKHDDNGDTSSPHEFMLHFFALSLN